MCLQSPRANTGNLREEVEPDGFGQVTSKPTDSAHQVGR